jgi:hypothetical protein
MKGAGELMTHRIFTTPLGMVAFDHGCTAPADCP